MQKTDVLAVVGDREITNDDLDTLIQSLNPQTAMQFQSEAGRRNLLTELTNQELFYLEAIDNGLDKDPEYLSEVEKAKAGILKQYSLSKLMNEIAVTEDEIANYYIENKSQFSASPGVKASHILVDTLEQAQSIEEQIKGGLSFEDASKEHSKCPSKAQGGDLGFFSKGMMVPEFEEAAFGMEEGQMSGPVKTQFGYHLIKVCEKRNDGMKTIDEVRDQIGNQLMGKKQQEMYMQKVNTLKEKYPVKINV